MATRTAPTIDGTPTNIRVSVTLIDNSGEIRTVSLIADPLVTDAQIETYVAAIQAASNASVYQCEKSDIYAGVRLASNADAEVYEDVTSNIVYHVKADPVTSQRGYVPSPDIINFVPDTETVDPTQATMSNWFAATLAIVGGSYAGQSVRFTQRRDMNDAQRF